MSERIHRTQQWLIPVLIFASCVAIALLFWQGNATRNDQARQFCVAIPNAAAAGATAASQALVQVAVSEAIKDGAKAARVERIHEFGADLTKRAASQARANARFYLPDCP